MEDQKPQPRTELGKKIYQKILWFIEQQWEYVFQGRAFPIEFVCLHADEIRDMVITPKVNTIQFGTFRNDWMKEPDCYASELKYGVMEISNLGNYILN